jgi:hypothetical protein
MIMFWKLLVNIFITKSRKKLQSLQATVADIVSIMLLTKDAKNVAFLIGIVHANQL